MANSPPRPHVDAYRYFVPVVTRWKDNDVYGHINNVVYYSYFDSVANDFLIREGGLDVAHGSVIGLVVESRCYFHAAAAYPQRLRAGLRVDRLGDRSVIYGLAVFRGGDDEALVHGYNVHVFVDRATRRPVLIPERLRDALSTLVVEGGESGSLRSTQT